MIEEKDSGFRNLYTKKIKCLKKIKERCIKKKKEKVKYKQTNVK